MEIRSSYAQQPELAVPQPPMVYVYDDPAWEYKFVPRNATQEWRISTQELNALGKEGWELVAVACVPSEAHFYFKRPRK